MNKVNHRMLRRAISLQSQVEKELSEYISDVSEVGHWQLGNIQRAAELIIRLLDDRYIHEMYSPVWSPLSLMNVREHAKELYRSGQLNLIPEVLVWRSQAAKRREDGLFGTVEDYLQSLLQYYRETANWKGEYKLLLRKIKSWDQDHSPGDTQGFSLYLQLSKNLRHQGKLREALSVLTKQMEPFGGDSKVGRTQYYRHYLLDTAEIYEQLNQKKTALKILESYTSGFVIEPETRAVARISDIMEMQIAEKIKTLRAVTSKKNDNLNNMGDQ